MRGNKVIRTCSISNGVSHSLDTEISPSHPESWREGIFGKIFSEGHRAAIGMRNTKVKYTT
jgi:hypothetical protein